MNDLYDMPPKCQECPYWEIAAKPYYCLDCEKYMYYANKEGEKQVEYKMEYTADYAYTPNPFIEFHLSNNQPILICLSKIVAIAKIIPNSDEGKEYLKSGANTLICVIDDEIPIVESYDKVKELIGA